MRRVPGACIALVAFLNDNEYCGTNQMLVQCDLIGDTSCFAVFLVEFARQGYTDGSFAESDCRKELVAEVVLVGELYYQRCRRSGC